MGPRQGDLRLGLTEQEEPGLIVHGLFLRHKGEWLLAGTLELPEDDEIYAETVDALGRAGITFITEQEGTQ